MPHTTPATFLSKAKIVAFIDMDMSILFTLINDGCPARRRFSLRGQDLFMLFCGLGLCGFHGVMEICNRLNDTLRLIDPACGLIDHTRAHLVVKRSLEIILVRRGVSPMRTRIRIIGCHRRGAIGRRDTLLFLTTLFVCCLDSLIVGITKTLSGDQSRACVDLGRRSLVRHTRTDRRGEIARGGGCGSGW